MASESNVDSVSGCIQSAAGLPANQKMAFKKTYKSPSMDTVKK
jgi:hypothetical protein